MQRGGSANQFKSRLIIVHFNYIPSPKSETHFRPRSCRNNIHFPCKRSWMWVQISILFFFSGRRGNVGKRERKKKNIPHSRVVGCVIRFRPKSAAATGEKREKKKSIICLYWEALQSSPPPSPRGKYATNTHKDQRWRKKKIFNWLIRFFFFRTGWELQ